MEEEGGGRGGKEEKLGGPSIFFGWNMGGLKMLKDDLGGGGGFKFLLSSIPTEQHDAWVLKDPILIQFYTKSYIV